MTNNLLEIGIIYGAQIFNNVPCYLWIVFASQNVIKTIDKRLALYPTFCKCFFFILCFNIRHMGCMIFTETV